MTRRPKLLSLFQGTTLVAISWLRRPVPTNIEESSNQRYHIWYNRLVPWTVETLNEVVDSELAELPAEMKARFVRIGELIEAAGLPNVREPHVKHLRGPLWEIRLRGKDGIARALYVTAQRQRVVVLRVFAKKTQKTPNSEIDLALQRMKELEK